MNLVIHDALGQILRTAQCPESMAADQLQPGETAIEGVANDATQYISGGAVVNKPALAASIDKTTVLANGADVATISGLPNPTRATISGGGTQQIIDVADGGLQLTFDTAGSYTVRLEAINKLPQEIAIVAN